MSSGLYVPARDLAWLPPGTGYSAEGRLCGICGRKSRNAGGGFIDGIWRCVLCKPGKRAKEKTTVGMIQWTATAHEHSLRNRIAITTADAVMMCGQPSSAVSPAKLLNDAWRNGWFRREEVEVEGERALKRQIQYTAVDREAQPRKKVDTRPSWFTDLPRVRSVFELGDVL